jgi:hypothetical protein
METRTLRESQTKATESQRLPSRLQPTVYGLPPPWRSMVRLRRMPSSLWFRRFCFLRFCVSLVPHNDTTQKNCTRKTNPFDVATKQKQASLVTLALGFGSRIHRPPAFAPAAYGLRGSVPSSLRFRRFCVPFAAQGKSAFPSVASSLRGGACPGRGAPRAADAADLIVGGLRMRSRLRSIGGGANAVACRLQTG